MNTMFEMEKEDMNLLYQCSLEFGEHWMRPLIEWTNELWSEWEKEKQIEISEYIEAVREEINDYINDRYDYKKYTLRETKEEVINWIKHKYPWMTEENIAHGFSQGMYYAWHG